jgi:hypothetical protein
MKDHFWQAQEPAPLLFPLPYKTVPLCVLHASDPWASCGFAGLYFLDWFISKFKPEKGSQFHLHFHGKE